MVGTFGFFETLVAFVYKCLFPCLIVFVFYNYPNSNWLRLFSIPMSLRLVSKIEKVEKIEANNQEYIPDASW